MGMRLRFIAAALLAGAIILLAMHRMGVFAGATPGQAAIASIERARQDAYQRVPMIPLTAVPSVEKLTEVLAQAVPRVEVQVPGATFSSLVQSVAEFMDLRFRSSIFPSGTRGIHPC